MFVHDKYYSVFGAAECLHPEYPPFLSLLELIFCILYGSFSESVVSTCLHIVSLAFFIVPYIDNFELKFKKSILLSSILILIIVLFDKYGIFRTVYIDIPLAFICSFPLVLLFSDLINTSFGKIYFSISLSCILLTKPSGIILYFFDLVLYFIVYIKKKNIKNTILDLVFYIFVSLMIYVPWTLYIYVFNSSVGTGSQFSVVGILEKIMKFQIDDKDMNIIKRIISYIFSENALSSNIYISYFIYYLVVISAVYVISKIQKNNNKYIISFSILSTIIFVISISFIYCLTMEDYELIYFRSLPRYIEIYNIYILVVFILFDRDSLNNVYVNILIVFILLVANIPNYNQFIPSVFVKGRVYEEATEGELNVADYISKYINDDSEVLVITDSISTARLSYLIMNKTTLISSSVYSNAYYNSDEIQIDELIKEIIEYDYVLFNIEQEKDFNIINESIKEYTNCDAIYNFYIYQILKDDTRFMYLLT